MAPPLLPDNSHMVARMTANDARVLAFIVDFKRRCDGCAPTVREIMEGCSFRSTSVVTFYLDRLEAQRRIRRHVERAAGIEVVGGRWVPPGEALHG